MTDQKTTQACTCDQARKVAQTSAAACACGPNCKCGSACTCTPQKNCQSA